MVGQLWFVLAMLTVVVLARGLGERIGVPFTILLTLAGLLYAFLPGPKLLLDPGTVLILVLPPLLYSTARRSSLLGIRAHLRPIVSLSVLLVLLTAFAVGVVLLLRPLWLLFTQSVPAWLHARLGKAPRERLGRRELIALSWAGTRGVISLAAIIAVPLTTSDGRPFPDRDLLLFCTYVVVLVATAVYAVHPGDSAAAPSREQPARDDAPRRTTGTRRAGSGDPSGWVGTTLGGQT